MPGRWRGDDEAPVFCGPDAHREGWQSMSQCSQPRGWHRLGGVLVASLVTAWIAVPAQASTRPVVTVPSLEIQAPAHVVAGQAITVTVAVRGARSVAGWEARGRFDSARAEFARASGGGPGCGPPGPARSSPPRPAWAAGSGARVGNSGRSRHPTASPSAATPAER